MCGTDIPMPALGAASGTRGGILTVASFCDRVSVLPTKTRPKKLRIGGSDGATYTFLLKVRALSLTSRVYATREVKLWTLKRQVRNIKVLGSVLRQINNQHPLRCGDEA